MGGAMGWAGPAPFNPSSGPEESVPVAAGGGRPPMAPGFTGAAGCGPPGPPELIGGVKFGYDQVCPGFTNSDPPSTPG